MSYKLGGHQRSHSGFESTHHGSTLIPSERPERPLTPTLVVNEGRTYKKKRQLAQSFDLPKAPKDLSEFRRHSLCETAALRIFRQSKICPVDLNEPKWSLVERVNKQCPRPQQVLRCSLKSCPPQELVMRFVQKDSPIPNVNSPNYHRYLQVQAAFAFKFFDEKTIEGVLQFYLSSPNHSLDSYLRGLVSTVSCTEGDLVLLAAFALRMPNAPLHQRLQITKRICRYSIAVQIIKKINSYDAGRYINSPSELSLHLTKSTPSFKKLAFEAQIDYLNKTLKTKEFDELAEMFDLQSFKFFKTLNFSIPLKMIDLIVFETQLDRVNLASEILQEALIKDLKGEYPLSFSDRTEVHIWDQQKQKVQVVAKELSKAIQQQSLKQSGQEPISIIGHFEPLAKYLLSQGSMKKREMQELIESVDEKSQDK